MWQVPPAQWEKRYERMTDEARRAHERQAADAAQRGARASAYLSARLAGHAHAHAVKRQNRVARAVRKALGFAYPDSAEVMF